MEPEAVGGLLDNLIQKYLKDALKDASFDYKAFLAHPKTKEAAQCLAVSLKAAAKLPFDLDDKGIDYALKALEELLDQYKNVGPVKVGAAPEMMEVRRWHSEDDVKDALEKVGIDPITIGFLALRFLMVMPDLFAAIKKLMGK